VAIKKSKQRNPEKQNEVKIILDQLKVAMAHHVRKAKHSAGVSATYSGSAIAMPTKQGVTIDKIRQCICPAFNGIHQHHSFL